MSKVTKQYSNPNNGGLERVSKNDGNFYIESCVGGEWLGERQVTRAQIESCMIYTFAPKEIQEEILA